MSLLKVARHNLKIYNAFFPKNSMSYLPPFQLTYFDMIQAILYGDMWDDYELR